MEEMAKPAKEFTFTANEYRMAFRLIMVSSGLYEDERELQTQLAKLGELLDFKVSDFWITSDFPVDPKTVTKPDGSHKITHHTWCNHTILVMHMEVKLSTGREGDPCMQGMRGYQKILSTDDVRFAYLRYFFSSLNVREVQKDA